MPTRNKMRFWPKLILLVVVIALLAFVGVRLFQMVLGLLDIFSTGGTVTVDPQFAVTEPMPTPRVYTDQDYDDIQGVREY